MFEEGLKNESEYIITAEEYTVQCLTSSFSALEGKCAVVRERRVTAEAPCELFNDIIRFVRSELYYTMFLTITGLDLGEKLQAVYHLARTDGTVLNLKLDIPKTDPVVESVTPLFNGAVFYERELEDLFGIKVNGLPEGRGYPLPESWPEGEYPLRKDWKAKGGMGVE